MGAEYQLYSYRSGGYMKVRTRSLFAALLVTGAVVACRGESPSPVAPRAVSLDKKVQDAGSSDTVTVYTRRTPFASDVSVSEVIGSNGGVLDLKAAPPTPSARGKTGCRPTGGIPLVPEVAERNRRPRG